MTPISTRQPTPVGAHLKAQATRLIRRGDSGPAVAELQRALNASGHRLEVDGRFGPLTQSAVKHYQLQHALSPDGVVGPKTLAVLARQGHGLGSTPAKGTSSSASTAAAAQDHGKGPLWRKYAAMVRQAGGQVCPGGKPTVLGLRQHHGGATTHYSDTFAVLHANGKVSTYLGSTRPGQSSSSLSPDVNGDGRGDVAMLRTGNYFAVPNGPHHGKPSFSVRQAGNHGSDRVAAWRDLNHDGFYSAQEKAWSQRHGVSATGILFHVGFAQPSSIGCMNLQPHDMSRFASEVGRSFSFTLVER